jgi:hypothetical protein
MFKEGQKVYHRNGWTEVVVLDKWRDYYVVERTDGVGQPFLRKGEHLSETAPRVMGVKFNDRGSIYHYYINEEVDVEEGDCVYNTERNSMCKVYSVGRGGNNRATKKFKGFKMRDEF